MNTAIAFFIFKRPDTTERVFKAIQQVKPSRLLVVADGPRSDRPGEVEQCAATRAIIDRVDWDCEVLKNYSEVNLGCAKRVSSGLDWVFSLVEEAIILEDDCVPHLTFFEFCEELLSRYRHDTRIMSISGQNVQLGHESTHTSYYFSRYNHCWGWATWKRAWHEFDFSMKLWPEVRDNNVLKDILLDDRAVKYWSRIFQNTSDQKYNSWAYRWTLACWLQGGLSIISSVNLVSNVGFSLDATNTQTIAANNPYAAMPTQPIQFPLQHPKYVVRNSQADTITQNYFYNPTLLIRLQRKIKRMISFN
ncbi:MAG: glycosyltransferase family 2 protein [Oscillatoriophycideae cyanobacterium NC_groundwater_1537_Pr4_S-0.65um_50_18]|nr:glycosyltransferase family 2 protein [Oscillatoriophycideae cyanobacterium NC_groundwater_1537_Pr4_S-0.65um_50_18]